MLFDGIVSEYFFSLELGERVIEVQRLQHHSAGKKTTIKQKSPCKLYSTAVNYLLEPGDRSLGTADVAGPESVGGSQILEDSCW